MKKKEFAPRNFCGVFIVVLNHSGKFCLLHQIWRRDDFIKRAMADIELIDYLLKHVPLDKWGTRMKLYRKRKDYTVWSTKMISGTHEISLTEILPSNNIWLGAYS